MKVRYFENMSRRKQSRPIRVLEDEELENQAPRTEGDTADNKDTCEETNPADIKDSSTLPPNTGRQNIQMKPINT